jgi:hypothetical protein
MYFTKHTGANSVAEFAVDQVMEIRTLMSLIETGLARSHCKIEWPVGFEGEEKVRKRAYKSVEGMVFGEMGERRV